VTEVGFPFGVDDRGRTAGASRAEHVRDLVEMVLLTAPGERVNRPTFGTPLPRLVHEPAHDDLAAATALLVSGALQQWLGDVITVDDVDAVRDAAGEGSVVVTVRYLVRATGEQRTERFGLVAP
jgi:phage baseplate assembly protein W